MADVKISELDAADLAAVKSEGLVLVSVPNDKSYKLPLSDILEGSLYIVDKDTDTRSTIGDAVDNGLWPVLAVTNPAQATLYYPLKSWHAGSPLYFENTDSTGTVGYCLHTDDTWEYYHNEDVGDVVEKVEELTEDLDKKVTTTYPFAQITTQADFAGYGSTNTTRMIGQLFAVPIASEIRKDETLLCINALQSFSGDVSFGIFEYDFEANNGTGSTYWIADTGVVRIQAGENHFPLVHVNNDSKKLESSKLYYAVVAIRGNAPATGLFLAASPNYSQNYNANPKYTLLVSNMDQYVDWSTGSLQGAWFQGYNEANTIPRLFMMLRNGDAQTPVPAVEPFTDIGQFTLQHTTRVGDVFQLTPNTEGAVYRKVIPQIDVDIAKFRYVDYHGSINKNNAYPVILSGNFLSLKTMGDGSWTAGDGDSAKIDGTHYLHEFTLTTPIHLTAGEAYYFLVGGNMNSQANEWLITYQSPSVTNDLLLVQSMWNVNPYIVPHSGDWQSQQPGMYLKLTDDSNNEWVI